MNSNISNDTKFKARVFAAPIPTPPLIQPNMQAQIAPTFCTVCGSGLLLLEKAARLCQRSPRVLYRWVEEESLHYRELADGSIMVCGHSLADQVSATDTGTNDEEVNEAQTLAFAIGETEPTTERLPNWLSSPQIYETNTDQ